MSKKSLKKKSRAIRVFCTFYALPFDDFYPVDEEEADQIIAAFNACDVSLFPERIVGQTHSAAVESAQKEVR